MVNNATVGWTLDVTWATNLRDNLAVAGNANVGGDATIVGTTNTSTITAWTWNITTLTWTDISATNIQASSTLASNGTLAVEWASTLNGVSATTITTSWDVTVGGNEAISGTLAVTWASTFTGDVSTNNIYSSGTASLNDLAVAWNETVTWTLTANWATLLNSSLTVVGNTTMWSNASVAGNLNVAWNETVTGDSTVGWNTTLNWKLTVAGLATFNNDINLNDDLTVTWTTHLAGVETTGSVDVNGTLRTSWAAVIWNGITVTGQVESDTVRTAEVVTDELRVNNGLYLSQWAEAPDFVLQSEKDQPNGIATLDENWKVDASFLPEVFTTAKVKIVQWVFNNSNTATVVDEDITVDSAVIVTNYQDIVGDTTETISVWQITVASNTTEMWSFKVVIFKPVS